MRMASRRIYHCCWWARSVGVQRYHAELADEADFRMARIYIDMHNYYELFEFVVSS